MRLSGMVILVAADEVPNMLKRLAEIGCVGVELDKAEMRRNQVSGFS